MIRFLIVLAAWALSADVGRAQSHPLPAASDSLIGAPQVVRSQFTDTLLDIAHRYDYGYQAILNANPELDPWLPGEDMPVLLPSQHLLPEGERRGLIVNLPEMRLYFYPPARSGEPEQVVTFPIGIGKEGWRMPEMQTRIENKIRKPVWYVPESIKREHAMDLDPLPDMVPPGPDNPLGEYALRLGDTAYLIHGSNRKFGIGMRISHGCLRLGAADIETLYARVPVGAPARIINQPYKAGTHAGRLYIEAHPPLTEDSDEVGKTAMVAAIIRATGQANYEIDWDRVFSVVKQASGLPTPVGRTRPPADRP